MKFQVIDKNNIQSTAELDELIDEIVNEYELGISDPYADSIMSKKIFESARILSDLIGDTTETKINYEDVSRSLIEVKGGYKIALNKGANLYEVPLFNFPPLRIKNSQIDTITYSPHAQIYPLNGERWILLCPLDTEVLIDYEKSAYNEIIKKHVKENRIKNDVYEELLENLDLLNINERCAQTLIHEYGHILHWKAFDKLFEKFSDILGVSARGYDYAYNALILAWFEKEQYIYNVFSRVPTSNTTLQEKINILKESFVEDYRIGLNMKFNNGKYILPNSQCVFGDLMNINLMHEGVEIVKEMINELNSVPSVQNKKSNEKEYDRINTLFSLDKKICETNWVPHEKMPVNDVHNFIEGAFKSLEVSNSIKELKHLDLTK